MNNESYQGKIQNDPNNLDYIQQYLDETVKINFKDLRMNTPSRHNFDNRSTASIASTSNKNKNTPSRRSLDNRSMSSIESTYKKDKSFIDPLEPKVKI